MRKQKVYIGLPEEECPGFREQAPPWVELIFDPVNFGVVSVGPYQPEKEKVERISFTCGRCGHIARLEPKQEGWAQVARCQYCGLIYFGTELERKLDPYENDNVSLFEEANSLEKEIEEINKEFEGKE